MTVNKIFLTYTAINTDDVTELLEWVIQNRLIGQRDDGSQFIKPLNTKLVGEIRHKIEEYTLAQFSEARVYVDGRIYMNNWHTTNLGKDKTFPMELNRFS